MFHLDSLVMYEAGAVTAHARSLWKIEYIRTKWVVWYMHACILGQLLNAVI